MMSGHDNCCNGQTLQSFLVYVNVIWQKISSKLEEISCGKYRRFNFNKKGLCCFFVNKMDFLRDNLSCNHSIHLFIPRFLRNGR